MPEEKNGVGTGFGVILEKDGAIRGVKEETGIDIKNPKIISVHNCKNKVSVYQNGMRLSSHTVLPYFLRE